MGTDQAVGGHEASHPLSPAPLVEAAELGMDPRSAIGGPGAPVYLGDEGAEFDIPGGVLD